MILTTNIKEAILHVQNGGKAWETTSWDTDSFMYLKDGKVYAHCGFSNTDFIYQPDMLDVLGTWELF